MALVFVPYYGPLFSSALLLWSFLYPLPEEGKGEAGLEEVRVFRLRQPGSLKELLEPEEEESFIPAVTLLKSNDIEERRAAIEVLARIGGPEQIRHLQSCLEDEEREIYQLAHAKLTALHERYTDAIRDAQNSQDLGLKLEKLTDYLASGLLGDATRDFYRQQAITTAVNLLDQHNGNDVRVLSTLGDLYLESEQLDLAAEVLELALQLDPDNLKIHWGLAKVHYEQRDFDNLRFHFDKLKNSMNPEQTAILPKDMLEVLSWWFGEHA